MIRELTNGTEKFTYNSGTLQYLLLTNVQVMQEILNREMQNLSEFIHLTEIINIYKNFHLNTKEYTFISAAHRTFS